jgi:hypothetical protein
MQRWATSTKLKSATHPKPAGTDKKNQKYDKFRIGERCAEERKDSLIP